jgi:hypothetical protein
MSWRSTGYTGVCEASSRDLEAMPYDEFRVRAKGTVKAVFRGRRLLNSA